MSILDQFNNDPIKAGYIFVPFAGGNHQLPPNYVASHLGAWGYFARLDANFTNGFEPIPFQIYQDA